MVATTTIFYSLIFVPLLLLIYVLGFALTAKLKFGYTWMATFRLTFTLAYVVPIYLYICIFYCYDFVRWGRLMWNQLRLRVLNREEGMRNFRMLLREKMELENEMLGLMVEFKEELKQFFEKMITDRKIGKQIDQRRIDEIVNDIK